MSKTSPILIFWPKMLRFTRFSREKLKFWESYWCKRFDKFHVWVARMSTGSKNDKRITVFMGTKFHKKLLRTVFFSWESATNLRSWVSRSAKITLWYPEKLAVQCAFRPWKAAWSRPLTLRPLSKGPFWSVRGWFSSVQVKTQRGLAL